jgi:hypothetical protein
VVFVVEGVDFEVEVALINVNEEFGVEGVV